MRKQKVKQKMALLLSMSLVVSSVAAPSKTVLAAGVSEPTSITLNVDSQEAMYVGMSEKVKVKSVKPKNGSKKVTYESSDPEVVKVSSGGTMKALTEGEAIITVTSASNENVFKEVEVNVKNLVKNKTYNKMVIPLDKKNKTKKLSRTSKVKATDLKLSSSRKKVATVSKAGVLTGKKAGTTKITIKGKKGIVKGAKQVITLYVAKKSVKTVALDKTSVTLKPSDTVKLTTTVTPSNAANVVVFTSSDEDVAVVDQKGNVKAVEEGTAEITATTVDGNKEAVCVVTVSKGTTEKQPGATTEGKPGTVTEDKTEATTGDNSGSTTEDKTEGTTEENTENPPEPEQPVTPENLTIQDMYEKCPYVSTYYFEPKPDYRQEVVIPIYVTDYEQSEYLKNDTTKTIDLLCEVDGEERYLRNIKLGDTEVNLGKLSIGEHYFALQAIDRTSGLKSHKLYNDLLVVDPEKEKITEEQTYQITDEDLARYEINKENSTVEDDMIHTRDGLTKLFADIQAEGYRKCILPQGTYRIKSLSRSECIYIPSYLTVDMNGSTFKLETITINKKEGTTEDISALIVSFYNVTDAHLINGTLEGDRMERKALGLENGYNGEAITTLAFYGGKYCSIDGLTIKNTTGHTVMTYGGAGTGSCFTEYTPVNVVNGEEVSDENCSTSNFIELTKIKAMSDYMRTGQGNGYRGYRGESPIIYIHFYDKDKNFLFTETGYQYRTIRIPEEALYARVTYLGTVDASTDKYNSFYVKAFGDFIEIKNIDFYDTRTTAMAPTTCSNLLIENCTYTRCGNSITPSVLDFEDGWQECQDVYYRNNTDLERVYSTVIDNTGFNHVYENIKGHRLSIRRSNVGCVVRNIDDMEGTSINWTTGNTFNSKFCRNYNNKTVSNIMTHGNESRELSKHKVKNCVMADENMTTSTDSVIYENCTFSKFGGKRVVCQNCTINSSGYLGENLYFYDCIFENPSGEEEVLSLNVYDAERVFENCKFNGKTILKNHNYFNSGIFKACEFEDLKMTVGVSNSKETNKGIKFIDCDIKSTADDLIYIGPFAYSSGYLNMDFNNCNITHTGGNLIFSYGRTTDDSSIQFDNCIINKDSGTLISGSSVKDESATSLNVIFKGGSVNKELDTTWCNGKEGIHIQYK